MQVFDSPATSKTRIPKEIAVSIDYFQIIEGVTSIFTLLIKWLRGDLGIKLPSLLQYPPDPLNKRVRWVWFGSKYTSTSSTLMDNLN
jgi:hypothetical protein